MGVWYKKYLQVYERPFAEAPQAVVEEVRQKIAGLQSENPVVISANIQVLFEWPNQTIVKIELFIFFVIFPFTCFH